MSLEYRRIRTEAVRSGKPYEDPDFPATSSSLTVNGVRDPTVKWLRPKELYKDARFVVDGLKYHDMTQGQLGNCWFISSAVILATNKKLFQRVCPTDQQIDDSGVVYFNFWMNGEWREVIIDDRLPTRYGYLVYSFNSTEKNEFWCPLLEKAYAKLHTCYELLTGGYIVDGLVDLTGGISEHISLPISAENDHLQTLDQLTRIILQCQDMNTIMGAGIDGSTHWDSTARYNRYNSGLMDEHAYSIVKIVKIHKNGEEATVLLVRDPNGKKESVTEWTGSWSDGSVEWQSVLSDVQRRIGYNPGSDGEFWISIYDFVKQFDSIALLHLTPDALTEEVAVDTEKQVWQVQTFKSSWVKYVSAVGRPQRGSTKFWKNPQFMFTRDDEDNGSTVVISLLRYLSPNQIREQLDMYIHFYVYKLMDGVNIDRIDNERYVTRIVNPNLYTTHREMAHRFELEPGTYFIIPSTYEEGVEADFILRIFTEKAINASSLDDDTGPTEIPVEVKPRLIESLFSKYNGDLPVVNSHQLQKIISEAKLREYNGKDGFTMETSRCVLSLYDTSNTGKLTISAVKECWEFIQRCKVILLNVNIDEHRMIDLIELRGLFKELGYNVGYNGLRVMARRYGDQHGQISEEDFIQCSAKLISLHTKFTKLFGEEDEVNISKVLVTAIS